MTTTNEKALNLLFHPENYPGMATKKTSDIKLILWRDNSLDKYTTWSFIETSERYTVRRIIWMHRTKYNLNEPETFCADAIISKKMFIQLSGSILKLNYTDIESFQLKIRIDGTEYGIILTIENLNGMKPNEVIKN